MKITYYGSSFYLTTKLDKTILNFNLEKEISAKKNLEELIGNYEANGSATAIFGDGEFRAELKLDKNLFVNGTDTEETAEDFVKLVKDGFVNGFEEEETFPVPEERRYEAGIETESALDDFITEIDD